MTLLELLVQSRLGRGFENSGRGYYRVRWRKEGWTYEVRIYPPDSPNGESIWFHWAAPGQELDLTDEIPLIDCGPLMGRRRFFSCDEAADHIRDLL